MKLLTTFLALLLLSTNAAAAAVTFASGDGIGESNSISGANRLIQAHPVWEQNHEDGGKWISHDDTGFGGIVVPNVAGIAAPPTALFYEIFMLAGHPSSGSLVVWADDTAGVSINGVSVVSLNPVQDANCASGAIGCTVGEGLLIDITPYLVQGANTISFAVYQRQGGPFGLLYEGSAVHSPEPATLGLFGASLIGLAIWARRRSRVR